jgi:outer membrane protein W
MARVGWLVMASVFASTTLVHAQPPHKKAKAQAKAVEDDEDDDDAPTKKPTRKKAKAQAKADDDDDDDDDAVAVKPVVHKRSPLEHAPRNELYFRAGLAYVDPQIKTGGLQLVATPVAQLAANPMSLQGGITSNNDAIFAANVGFSPAVFHNYVAFETVLGIPSSTKFQATGPLATQSLAPTALGAVPTGIPPLGSDLGQATATPIMVTAIGRLPLGPVTLYAGGGPSILFITNTQITNKVLNEVASPQFAVTPAAGVIAQAGVDVHIWGKIYARVDFKELWFETSTATISNIQVHTTIPLLETVDVGSVKSQFTANPVIYEAGIGATF